MLRAISLLTFNRHVFSIAVVILTMHYPSLYLECPSSFSELGAALGAAL